MSFLRPTTMRALRPMATPRSTRVFFSTRSRLLSDYGSGTGDPKGENPQEQGRNPSVDKEHPGPPPPSAATGKQSGGSSSQSQKQSSQQQPASSSSGQQSGKPQPKILSESAPQSNEASDDVKKHNEDMGKRAERSNAQVNEDDHGKDKDKVDPSFWKGQNS